jgi:hypothetical protein
LATTKAFELAQLSAVVTSSSGVSSFTDALDINGAEILVGTNNSRFAENNLRFMATGASYIDVNTVGQALNFRVSENSSLDTTAISIADDGKVTMPNLIGNTTVEHNYAGTYPSATSRVLTLKNTNTTSDSVSFGLRTTAGGTGSVAKTIDFINTDGTLVLRTTSNSTGTLAHPFELDNFQLNITPTTTSTSTTTGAIITAGGAGIAENLYVGGNTVISGDLTVEGTSVTLNTTDLNVEDKNITLNYHASNDTSASAGGAGITIQDAVDASNDASILWDATNDEFDVSHSMKIAGSVGVTNIVTNRVPKFNGTILDDSNITDDGTTITASSDFNTSGQMTFTTNAKAIRMRDSNGLYTRSMILNASDVFYIGPVDTYAGGAILYGASADVTDQQFHTGGTLRHITKSTGDFQWYEDNDSAGGGTPAVGMHWDYADGRLGIGTDSPQAPLDIDGAYMIIGDGTFEGALGRGNSLITGQTPSDFVVSASSSNDLVLSTGAADRLHILSTGTVGIGTSSPNTDALLHISSGTSGNAIVIIESDTDNDDENDNPQLQFKQDNGVTIAKVGLTGDAGEIFTDSLSNAAYLGNDEAASVQLYTNGIARLTIESGGDVGIGTNVPDCALDVTRTTGWAEMHLDGASGGDLLFKDNGVSYGEVYAGDGHGLVIKSYASQDIYFLTNANATPKMVIKSGGNIGIGVDPALHKLDVDGAIATRQVRHSLRPSLNLDFANSKQLDPRIAFYRSSGATYYDNRGIVRHATENEPRFDHDPVTGESKGLLFEEARTNIALGVTNFGIPIDFNGMYNIPNTRLAPDGTMSATDVLANAGISRHEVNIRFSGTNGINYSASFYVKPLGAVTHISVSFAGGSEKCNFDLVNMTHNTPGGTAVVTITDAGNGWRRVTLRGTENATGTRSIYISPGIGATSSSVYNTLNGDSLNGVSLWGCQIEAADFATSLVPLDTRFTSRASSATYYDETGIIRTAPADYPRYSYNYDGRKWVETGLILEGSATNKIPQNSIPAAAYQSTNTYGYYAPDGSYKAFQNIPNSGTSPGGAACIIYSSGGFDNTTSKHTLSIYVKGVQGFDRVRLHDNNNNRHVVFNLTGMGSFDTATNIVAAQIQFIGNGWYRIGMTYIPSTNTTPYFQMYSMETGNGSGGFQFFGAQAELGDKMTSFIHTTTANVTRAADIYTSISTVRERDYAIGQDVDKLLPDVNASNIDFTLYGDIQGIAHNGGFQQAIYLEDTSDSGNMYVSLFSAYNGNSTISSSYNINSTSRNFGNWTSTASDIALRWKIAMGVEENDSRAAANGSLGSSAAGYWNGGGTFDRFYLGNGYQGGRYFNGWIRKIGYYDKRLSNDELVALTENN